MKRNYSERIMSNDIDQHREEEKGRLTRCSKSLIKEAINALPVSEQHNKSKIMESLSEIVAARYATGDEENDEDNNKMNYHLTKMNMATTSAMGLLIDTYIFQHIKLQNR